MTEGTAPAIAGPAGATFEAQVGAFYLLSLLANTEARGLPGAKIDRVGLQKAPEGLELDDVVINGVQDDGTTSVLEIQVKRTVRFTSGDSVWKKVVGQIAAAVSVPGFWTSRHELAVAIAKTTAKIDGPYQDVLMWTRNLGSAAAFFARLNLKGVASEAMRAFVQGFKENLEEQGHASDDETVWKILRRFQILTFDFTVNGSVCQELAKDRASRLLDATKGESGDQLWNSLVVSALTIASHGGDRNRAQLLSELIPAFHFHGLREIRTSFNKLHEAAQSGLSDIDQKIGDTSLARSQYVAKLREHLDRGRYIEIRGDSGTGKSAILRQLADQVCAESRIVYLSPHRTFPGGWLSFQLALQTDFGLAEFLSELAANGGATVFIDNLDFFSEATQATAKDIVRHASLVPGVNVVVTCRKSFGVDVPSWLPSAAIESLGGTSVVEVAELSDEELAELATLEPRLSLLLSPSNPARPVVANLFRLSRLAQGLGSEAPTTEVAMGTQWWRSSDNLPVELRRDGSRLLRAMAEHSLCNNQPFDTRIFDSSVIESLVKRGTLRDLRTDEVAFKHDVLRDWAIANFLYERPEMVATLPLSNPLRSSLLRAIDLLARQMIEGEISPDKYFDFLNRLSASDIHGSWRRPVILALVRSEAYESILELCRPQLLSNGATLLSELIRTLMAVEVQSAPKYLQSLGLDASNLVEGVKFPTGPAWRRLIDWLLKQKDSDLFDALQDVVDLFSLWSFATFGIGAESQKIIERFHVWLISTELSRRGKHSGERLLRSAPFAGAFQRESLIRRSFLQFAHSKAAKEYLCHVAGLANKDDIARDILKHSGSLAKTAPAELASFTVASLIPSKAGIEEEDEIRTRLHLLTLVDNEFMPVGPGQGPFLLLLINSSANGLSAIREIIDHVVRVKTGGRDPGPDSITIRLDGRCRRFGWEETYLWSHGNYDCFSVASALMALEAWGHQRIEAGESVKDVLDDVLGSGDQPMCYLAVAIDLILSHWDMSAPEAVPFLGNPNLLILDRERQVFDRFSGRLADNWASESRRELTIPGFDTAEMLANRPSRVWTLLQCLGEFAFSPDDERRRLILALLAEARDKLGSYDKNADLSNPAFMAAHAMHRLERSNWKIESTSEGSLISYIGPESERAHLEAMESRAQSIAQRTHLITSLDSAIKDPSRSSEALARAGVAWAKAHREEDEPGDAADSWVHGLTITRAAVVAMRDGDLDLRQAEWNWAVDTFTSAFETDADARIHDDSELEFSQAGMAFLGIASAMNVRRWQGDVELLLKMSQSRSNGPARAFEQAFDGLFALDHRLPKSVLRVALSAQINIKSDWEDRESTRRQAIERVAAMRRESIAAEVAWLFGSGVEPSWPAYPDPVVRRTRRIFNLPSSEETYESTIDLRTKTDDDRSSEYVDVYGAYCWLRSFANKSTLELNPWTADLVLHFRPWTLKLNGVGLTTSLEVASDSHEWNGPYFSLMLKACDGFSDRQLRGWLDPILTDSPDEYLCRAARSILFELDQAYFNNSGNLAVDAVAVRASIADRLTETSLWKWRSRNRALEIDLELGGVTSALFFGTYLMAARSICYLKGEDMDHVDPFVPALQRVVSSGSFGFVAVEALNFLEVKPDERRLPFAAECLRAWINHFGDNKEFWVDLGIGSRICALLMRMGQTKKPGDLFDEIAKHLPRLVRLGVTEAKDLEEFLSVSQS